MFLKDYGIQNSEPHIQDFEDVFTGIFIISWCSFSKFNNLKVSNFEFSQHLFFQIYLFEIQLFVFNFRIVEFHIFKFQVSNLHGSKMLISFKISKIQKSPKRTKRKVRYTDLPQFSEFQILIYG